ncbi:uncharacterized protein TOT_010001003 [Theileria orientalis strain Shintoku]|uniref:RAP domain-containing protein n=1 Tax=Theileria orientalis strain Shintoku TaxID=869250 RepID=J4C7S5_THEOR|nr:uncharacterized protein TOT_010001003 [Theileria orientalis strain Shintoku]BAM39548.1 uncharacterized protein TOT_010001003 [Theileria orientalis strain Shintoku]|eukprot:XP_009689849.1 uncharacterized protein TOT_010001003 [Theileria orientalis strain Shintoku]
MYNFNKILRCVKYPVFHGRFYSVNQIPSLLENTIGELNNDQIIYSFDTLSRSKITDWNLWDRLCDKIRFNLDSLEVSDLLKITHSLAKVSYKKLSLLNVINRIVLRKYKSIDTRSLTQYLIDLNKLDVLKTNIFIPLVTLKINEELSFFSTFDLCFILHLCSKLQYRDESIIDRISTKLLTNESNYHELCSDKALLAMVLRSLCFLQNKNAMYHTLLYQKIPPRIYTFGSQELCNILLSIVVSNIDEKINGQLGDIVCAIIDRISEKLSLLVDIEVNQIGICLHFLKYNMDPFPSKYETLLDSIIKLNMKYAPNTSKMQLKLSKLLDEIKLKYKSEYQLGPYRLDYVVPKLNVAIEVNGYTHFFHNSRELNALTQLKYKILKDMGWNVVGVNYYNWKNRNKQDRLEYLIKELSPYINK